jgi:hypothetical protein
MARINACPDTKPLGGQDGHRLVDEIYLNDSLGAIERGRGALPSQQAKTGLAGDPGPATAGKVPALTHF